MIDTHCHLLPGLDDGTRSPSEAIALAAELRDAGVRTVLCTPHLSRRFPTDLAVARERLAALVAELEASGIALELRLAAELSPNFAVMTGKLRRLSGRATVGRPYSVELGAPWTL